MTERMPENTLFYACKYTPLELFSGFGVTTTALVETDSPSFGKADSLGHPNLCGYGKGLIERLLEPDVHEVVLVTCCDVIRRVYDVLKAEGRIEFLYLLDLPHKRGQAETKLFRSRLLDLATRYQDYSGRSFDIGKALAACREPLPETGRHVSLMGAHATSHLIDTVQDTLGMPVDNLTCTGRQLRATVPEHLARVASDTACDYCQTQEHAPSGAPTDLETFIDWYAGALLNQMPCMRMDDIDERADLLRSKGQAGIVYHTMKFCEYYGFEYAGLLHEDQKPMVKIETDGTSQSVGQLRTRLEAFKESLPSTRENTPVMVPKQTSATATSPLYVMGIDSGSTSTDVVIMDKARSIVSSAIVPTGAKAKQSMHIAIKKALNQAGLSEEDIVQSVATGYGRNTIAVADNSVTEITCHAKGAHYLMPSAHTVIDIGGQDSKVIHIDDEGNVLNFVMNDKCAAGTGRFMEMMARTLEMPLEEMSKAGLSWKKNITITSMCTVFAESEVVSLVAENAATNDIIHGLDVSIARKTTSLAKRVDATAPYIMTGGIARNEGVVAAMEKELDAPVKTDPRSQLCGAIGAALIALETI